jgi:hypothetical protein
MVNNMEKRYVFKSLFEDKGLSVRRSNGDEQNAAEYAEMHVPLGADFPVFVQFEGDQEASCRQWMQ